MPDNSNSVDMLRTYRERGSYYNYTMLPFYDPRYSHHFPYFGYGTIELMMRDSRIRYGLGLIKGPIFTYTKFFSKEESEDPEVNQAIIELEYHFSYKVEAESPETEKFVLDTLNKFWNNGLLKALRAIEWGFAPHQTIYTRDDKGLVQYDNLICYHPREARPISYKKTDLVGLYLKTRHRKIKIPKAFIHVHQRELDPFSGQSRLYGSHIPWHETWSAGGGRDVRRLWYFKNAYDSGTLYVPEGSTTDPMTGEEVTNVMIGMEMMDKQQSGSYRVFTKRSGDKNQREWDYEDPKSRSTPEGLREYIQDLRAEELEGLGIPPEIVESDTSQGMGSSTGRKVPFLAFIATLAPIVTEVLADANNQIIRPLLLANKMNPNYQLTRIIPKRPLETEPGIPPSQQKRDSNADSNK